MPQAKSSFSDVSLSSTQLTVQSFPVVTVLHMVPGNANWCTIPVIILKIAIDLLFSFSITSSSRLMKVTGEQYAQYINLNMKYYKFNISQRMGIKYHKIFG